MMTLQVQGQGTPQKEDLLASMEALANACEYAERALWHEIGTTPEFAPSAALAAARAIIAKSARS